MENQGELANPGLPEKRPLNGVYGCVCVFVCVVVICMLFYLRSA